MKNAAGNSSISYTITLWKNTPLFFKIKRRLPSYETASFYYLHSGMEFRKPLLNLF